MPPNWPHELLLASALVKNNKIMITYREITIIFEFHLKILQFSLKKDGDTYGDIHVFGCMPKYGKTPTS